LRTIKLPSCTVKNTVQLGYQHIDTAQAYENKRGVGEGVRTCDAPRRELFVTTKLTAEVKTYDEAVRTMQDTYKVGKLRDSDR